MRIERSDGDGVPVSAKHHKRGAFLDPREFRSYLQAPLCEYLQPRAGYQSAQWNWRPDDLDLHILRGTRVIENPDHCAMPKSAQLVTVIVAEYRSR